MTLSPSYKDTLQPSGRFDCRWKTCLGITFLLVCTALGQSSHSSNLRLEAEDFSVREGWRVVKGREGFFPSMPNLWSGDRLWADASDRPAVAKKEAVIPHDGTYHVWVRHESSYGFDALFEVEIAQSGSVVARGDFGAKSAAKYFPFGRGWQVQGPWDWHNTDYVYAKMTCQLKRGKAVLTLKKGRNGQLGVARIVDFVYLTDDLALQPGDDWAWTRQRSPDILGQFTQPVYLKVEVPSEAVEPCAIVLQNELWLIGYYKGPLRKLAVTSDGLVEAKGQPSAPLPPGFRSKWMRLECPSILPAIVKAMASSKANLAITRNPEKEKPVVFEIGPEETEIVVSTGNSLYEETLLRGRAAVRLVDYLDWVTREVERFSVPGRRAKRFGLLSGFLPRSAGFDMRRLAAACGLTGQHLFFSPEVYGPEGERFGFNRSQGYMSYAKVGIQNAHMTRACYEGDYAALAKTYEVAAGALKELGLSEIPQDIKLIEEGSPPPLAELRSWPKVNEIFRSWLKQRGFHPADALGEGAARALVRQGRAISADELWGHVALGTGSIEESRVNPVLFYHSQLFRQWLFAQNCAKATEMLIKAFGPKTKTNSGSFYPSTGNLPVAQRVEPFLLFKERGAISFMSEVSWGIAGTPDYLGPQTESYSTALGRALVGEGPGTIGNYLIADGTRGCSPDYIELASYAMAAQGATWWDYYTLTYPTENCTLAYPEILKRLKKISYALGMVEDDLLASRVLAAPIAIGWNRTTDLWDPAVVQSEDDGINPGNCIYPQERHNLYLLLRHLQWPVDLVSEDALAEGQLKAYRVYFLVGDHLRQDSAKALAKWVEDGGVLVSVAGGGLLDELNQPLDTLKPVFGIKEAPLVKSSHVLRPKLELLHSEPCDWVTLSQSEEALRMPVLGYRQEIVADKATVLGVFDNGKPAVVMNRYGKGQALLIGCLPGTAYLKGAFEKAPYGRGGEDLSTNLFPRYNAAVRKIVAACLARGVEGAASLLPVVQCNDPLVEASVRKFSDGRKGLLVALVNFNPRPVRRLELKVDTRQVRTQSARAAFASPAVKREGTWMTVTLPLDRFEVVTLEEAP